MGFNNPTQLAIDEAKKIWSGREIGLVVSIGTGSSPLPIFTPRAFLNPITWWSFGSNLVSRITSSTAIDQSLLNSELTERDQYFRFDVDNMEKVGLDEWKSLKTVEQSTINYMDEEANKMKADRVAKLANEPRETPPLPLLIEIHHNREQQKPSIEYVKGKKIKAIYLTSSGELDP